MNFQVKNIADIKTISVKAEKFPEGINEAFEKLESALDSLKGRKFYGTAGFNNKEQKMEYSACLVPVGEEEIKKLGFEKYVIPGGEYVSAKLLDWPNRTREIAKTFAEISSHFNTDSSRPQVEFYRSQKELILMSPIK